MVVLRMLIRSIIKVGKCLNIGLPSGESIMELKLKEIRQIKGLSQQAVADSLHCSSVSYSRYETGNRCPSLDLLIKIAEIYDVSIDYLLGRQEITANALTPYEIKLVTAARKADDRAKSDALELLLHHQATEK